MHLPESCGDGSSRINLMLRNTGDNGATVAVAEELRAFWTSTGWTVTNVIEPSAEEAEALGSGARATTEPRWG